MKGKLPRILAIIIMVLGVMVAFMPKFIFPICESTHLGFSRSYEPVMRCFWFGQMELILGGFVVLCSLIFFARPTTVSGVAMGSILISLGLVIILVSLNICIGSTCGHMHSLCQMGTKPAERIAGAIVSISGLLVVGYSRKRYDRK